MIDGTTEPGARALDRLGRELVIWLTTVAPSGQPQSAPVWFLWEDDAILVYSVKGSARARNIAGQPRVALNLNSSPGGGDLVVLEGEAVLDPSIPASSDHPAYAAKYRPLLDEYGWTPEYFATEYPDPIRIRVTKARVGG
jgi:PPOX class probable F420-dependent enzyme